MRVVHDLSEESKAYLAFLVQQLKEIKVTVVVEIKK